MDQFPPSVTTWPVEFYTKYYNALATSRANAAYCAQLYGRDLGQHGFAEVMHLDEMARICGLSSRIQTLDLGCGDGRIAEYLSDLTGASITGIDFIPQAIQHAQARTIDKSERLHFEVMDMANLKFPPASFDLIYSIDTLYFINLTPGLAGIVSLLRPEGKLAAFFSQGADPGRPLDKFDRSTCHPDHTELADGLNELNMAYQTWDYTQADYEHARRKQAINESLKADFIAEGNLFLYENHLNEARGVQEAFEAGAHARYLYLTWKRS